MHIAEQRRLRILELERELVRLREEELEYLRVEHEAMLEECCNLKKQNKPIEAMKLFRSKIGCTAIEARSAIEVL